MSLPLTSFARENPPLRRRSDLPDGQSSLITFNRSYLAPYSTATASSYQHATLSLTLSRRIQFVFKFSLPHFSNRLLFLFYFFPFSGINNNTIEKGFNSDLGFCLDEYEEVITENDLLVNGVYMCPNCSRRLLYRQVVLAIRLQCRYPSQMWPYFIICFLFFFVLICSYVSKHSLKRHLLYDHSDPKFKCLKCSAKFRYSFQLKRHTVECHNGRLWIIDNLPNYQYVLHF